MVLVVFYHEGKLRRAEDIKNNIKYLMDYIKCEYWGVFSEELGVFSELFGSMIEN